MAGEKKPSICLLCLKSFQANSLGERSASYQVRLLNRDYGLLSNDLDSPGDPKSGIYFRFMKFVGRYFKLNKTVERFISSAKENTDGGDLIIPFCSKCLELVHYLCDIYAELQIVNLHLIWKLEEISGVMKRAKKTRAAMSKLKKVLIFGELADQLNMTKGAEQMERFRQVFQLKCNSILWFLILFSALTD